MRAAIYQHLAAHCRTVPTWMQPYTADHNTSKPYGVIVIGEVERSPINRVGLFRDVYIWPYLQRTSFVAVDEAVREIRSLLTDVVLTTEGGFRFTLEFVREGKDFDDDVLQAFTRRIDFRVPLVGAGL